MTGTTVTAIDPGAARGRRSPTARELGYDRLLLATGAEPRRIPVPGAELDGVHYLRTLADCDVLRERLDARRPRGGRRRRLDRQRVRRLGAPARARGHGRSTRSRCRNERIFGPRSARFYRDVHAQHGVELLLGEGVEAFEGDGAVARVRTAAGRAIECDFAVVGIGVVPRVELAEQAGLEVDNGIARRRAAADLGARACSPPATSRERWHPFYGERIRVEHWANALNQGPAAARAMLGEPVSYDRIPYFFSDQYDVGMEYSGYAPEMGRGRLPRRPATAASSSPSGCEDGRVVAGHERQRLGRQRARPGADPLAPGRRRRRAGRPRHAARRRWSASSRRKLSGDEHDAEPNLQRLHDAGVSIWLDTLSRQLLDERRVRRRLIRDFSVTGATSNPTIFAKAITGSDLYDDQLRGLAAAGERDAQELFFALALEDVRAAARELRPAYERSGGRDGFISFECTPDLADDTEATIAQASDLWQRLDQPNVMIKVPGTAAGLPAIEELTRRGVNVNVTLLFAIERYEEVIDAYLRGLTARAAGRRAARRGSPRSRRSSSRASTPRSTPQLPEESPLRGRVAIASARVAYQRYLAKFAGAEWERLRVVGAKPQRPLWASTGTKDPAYSDVLYVAELIGPDVINTMPEQTLRAFADHGEVAPHARRRPAPAPRRRSPMPLRAGIDLDAVTAELEREGVQSFCDSYRQLLDCIESKLGALATAAR